MPRGWWLWAASCAPDPPAEPEWSLFSSSVDGDCSAERLEVACGAAQYAPFSTPMPGEPAVMVRGPAGGWFVFFALDVVGAQSIFAQGTLTLPNYDEVAFGDSGDLPLDLPEPCGGQAAGLRAFIDTDAPEVYPATDPLGVVCAMVGEPMRLRATVEERQDPLRTATCEVLVTAALDPVDAEACAAL